jgi:hypothetical protein
MAAPIFYFASGQCWTQLGTIQASGSYVPVSIASPLRRCTAETWEQLMNKIIWLVGAIVIVLANGGASS